MPELFGARRLPFRWLLALFVAASCATIRPAGAESSITIEPGDWRIVSRDSGPVNYYTAMHEGGLAFVRAQYRPPWKTALLGWQTPDADRQAAKKLRWTWRARVLPNGGDECAAGKGDSAAVVYVTWKRGLKYYALKYVWSAVGKKGSVCDKKRNLFVSQDTIILDSGPPLDTWRNAEIDLRSEFRAHFEGGNAAAEVPDFVGIGIMSDGDQTQSESAADFGQFTVVR